MSLSRTDHHVLARDESPFSVLDESRIDSLARSTTVIEDTFRVEKGETHMSLFAMFNQQGRPASVTGPTAEQVTEGLSLAGQTIL